MSIYDAHYASQASNACFPISPKRLIRLWKMAPLRECVSNFMSGAECRFSSSLTGNRTLVGTNTTDKSVGCVVCLVQRPWQNSSRLNFPRVRPSKGGLKCVCNVVPADEVVPTWFKLCHAGRRALECRHSRYSGKNNQAHRVGSFSFPRRCKLSQILSIKPDHSMNLGRNMPV